MCDSNVVLVASDLANRLSLEARENGRLQAELGRLRDELFEARQARPLPAQVTEQDLRELIRAAHLGQRIVAIKVVRQVMGIGLKEAKDLVCEAMPQANIAVGD